MADGGDTANKVLATVGGLLFAGCGAILAGRKIQEAGDAQTRQLLSAAVIFGIVIVIRVLSAGIWGYGVPQGVRSRAGGGAGAGRPAARRRARRD